MNQNEYERQKERTDKRTEDLIDELTNEITNATTNSIAGEAQPQSARRASRSKSRFARKLRLGLKRRRRRHAKTLNRVDKQGLAFVLTLAVGIAGVTAAWSSGRLSDDFVSFDPALQGEAAEMPVLTPAAQETFEEALPDTDAAQETLPASNTADDLLSSVIMPVDGEILQDLCVDSLRYNETLNQWQTHNGIDFKADIGADVFAVLDGTVESVEEDALLGLVITLAHADGVKSVYAGLADAAEGISAGKAVARGSVIGHAGDSAAFEAHLGPHLHFALTDGAGYIDPWS